MRLTRTFLLRLYTDPAVRERTCGDLQVLPRRTAYPFKDDAELLALLQRLGFEDAGGGADSRTLHRASDPDPPDQAR